MKKGKKYPVFLICAAFLLLLFLILLRIDSAANSGPLRELKSFPAKAIGLFPYDRAIPLRHVECSESAPHERLELRGNIPRKVFSQVLFDRDTKELFVEICWSSQTIFGGKEIYRYEVDDPTIRQNLIEFIQTHAKELFSLDFQEKYRKIYIQHFRKLKELGDGDPYVGLERAGVADWIKEGKDPEAEWAKKFPVDGKIQQK